MGIVNGRGGLALLAFLGGLSAAASMVIAALMAMATMVSNDLVLPVLLRADALGLELLTRGMINAGETDVFGRMRLEHAFGKISSSVIHLESGFPEQWAAFRAGQPLTAASAVLEARLLFRRLPPAGGGYVLRSGLSRVNEKVRTLTHWVCDPETGAGLWSMEAVGCLMDLETRTLKPVDAETLAMMRGHVVEGLAP